MTVGCPTLIDVKAAEPKESSCITGERAPLSTRTAFVAVLRAILDGFAKNRDRRSHSHVTYRRWYVWLKYTEGGGADPTPMMENIRIFPRDGGKQFTFKMCPDTGCTMTLIAENVEARQGMTMDTRSWKRVRAVNGQRLNNSGTVVFGIEYQGQTTEVEALVSLSIEGKVLLSWQIL